MRCVPCGMLALALCVWAAESARGEAPLAASGWGSQGATYIPHGTPHRSHGPTYIPYRFPGSTYGQPFVRQGGPYISDDTPPMDTYRQRQFLAPHGSYVTQPGGHHHHYPPPPRSCVCQTPVSICCKPKIWKFSQAFYQLHHEFWHGVTDPCWLMDPECCPPACHHQQSLGMLDLMPWLKRRLAAKAARRACRAPCGYRPCRGGPCFGSPCLGAPCACGPQVAYPIPQPQVVPHGNGPTPQPVPGSASEKAPRTTSILRRRQ